MRVFTFVAPLLLSLAPRTQTRPTSGNVTVLDMGQSTSARPFAVTPLQWPKGATGFDVKEKKFLYSTQSKGLQFLGFRNMTDFEPAESELRANSYDTDANVHYCEHVQFEGECIRHTLMARPRDEPTWCCELSMAEASNVSILTILWTMSSHMIFGTIGSRLSTSTLGSSAVSLSKHQTTASVQLKTNSCLQTQPLSRATIKRPRITWHCISYRLRLQRYCIVDGLLGYAENHTSQVTLVGY